MRALKKNKKSLVLCEPPARLMCHIPNMSRKTDIRMLLKYFRCETDAAETRSVEKWLADDPDGSHAREYKEARVLFEGMTIHAEAVPVKNRHLNLRKVLYSVAGAAAVAVLVIAAGFMGSEIVRDDFSSRMMTYNVPAGNCFRLTLADGTELWMNGGSEVEVPSVFAANARNIRLNEGEIYLSVERDEKRPFTVETFAGDIRVLGTKFNVKADTGRDYFSTSLIEGSVSLKSLDGQEFLMEPNDVVVMKNSVWTRSRMTNPYSVTCWKDGLIDIANIEFDKLMLSFEKAFNVNVVIARKDLPELKFTMGKVRVSDGVESALDILKMSADFDYEIDKTINTIYIK